MKATSPDIWQEVNVNSDGLSVVAYSQQADGRPVTEGEAYWTWDELDALREEHND